MQTNSSSRKVFLNPNFKNTHINPNFLLSTPPSSIHINPEFLQRLHAAELNGTYQEVKKQDSILISRTKIIREPMKQNMQNIAHRSPMIKIGRTKLVRASAINKKSSIIPPKLNVSSRSRTISKGGTYKIDRRIIKKTLFNVKLPKKDPFVSKYALRRSSVSENLASKKLVVTKKKLLKIGSPNQPYAKGKFSPISVNKKLELLNINGVLYRSTKNKLQKADPTNKEPIPAPKQPSSGRAVFIKGDKFVLDKSGKSLTRVVVPNCEKMKLKRIDIGGLTYIAKSNNVFVRTETHKTRNHLSVAKQKSINTLSRNVVKTNIPCPIFRKVGKCASYERRKCPKVHDRKQVAICPRFLKGECTIQKCLLSHDVTLSKMPTCKFFLQGICVRENCPYLHKKLGENARVCIEFVRGFCQLADKCNKRHEFVCPDIERTGKCEKVKCLYCSKSKKVAEECKRGKQRKLTNYHKTTQLDELEEKVQISRYFFDDSENTADSRVDEIVKEKVIVQDSEVPDDDNNQSELSLRRRPKLGVLPAFIPL